MHPRMFWQESIPSQRAESKDESDFNDNACTLASAAMLHPTLQDIGVTTRKAKMAGRYYNGLEALMSHTTLEDMEVPTRPYVSIPTLSIQWSNPYQMKLTMHGHRFSI
jgi:hypothetical protein